jgi:hypothetical protein
MVHVEPQGSPNRVVKERRPFLLVLYNKNCVCKLQSIEKDKAQRNKRSAGDYMEFSAKGPLCEQYRLATGGLVARLDHKVKCTFFAAFSMTVDATQNATWKVVQVSVIIFEPNKCPIIPRKSIASEISMGSNGNALLF